MRMVKGHGTKNKWIKSSLSSGMYHGETELTDTEHGGPHGVHSSGGRNWRKGSRAQTSEVHTPSRPGDLSPRLSNSVVCKRKLPKNVLKVLITRKEFFAILYGD